jgi:hypothetical protein
MDAVVVSFWFFVDFVFFRISDFFGAATVPDGAVLVDILSFSSFVSPMSLVQLDRHVLLLPTFSFHCV